VINFTNIFIEELSTFYNQYSKPLFFDCFFCGLGVPYNVYQTSYLNPDDYYEQPERKWAIDDALDVLFGVKK
jgi:hypothetical protein